MSAYCSVDDVSVYVLREAGAFDANSRPTSTQVLAIIADMSDHIDDYTQRSFSTANTATDELLDAFYSDKWRWHGDYICHFRTVNRPIVTMTKIEVVQGGTYVDITGSGQDRTSTWYMNAATGDVYIVGSDIPSVLRNAVRVTYTWGEASVPNSVRGACKRLVAAELMESEQFSALLPLDQGSIASADKLADRWRKQAYEMLDRVVNPVYAVSGG